MKIIGFIGGYDKTNLLLNMAEVMKVVGKKVLVIDTTVVQKTKYVVPVIEPTISYITTLQDIDVAVGFKSINDVQNYVGTGLDSTYDIILVDCDEPKMLDTFNLEGATKNYFVTDYDLYSLRKGLEVFENIKVPIELTRVVFTQEVLPEDDQYLDYLSSNYNIKWIDSTIYFPISVPDYLAIIENERAEKVKFKKISAQYKDSMSFIIQQILDENSDSEIRKAVRRLERGE